VWYREEREHGTWLHDCGQFMVLARRNAWIMLISFHAFGISSAFVTFFVVKIHDISPLQCMARALPKFRSTSLLHRSQRHAAVRSSAPYSWRFPLHTVPSSQPLYGLVDSLSCHCGWDILVLQFAENRRTFIRGKILDNMHPGTGAASMTCNLPSTPPPRV
jgi:hypothetical protein